MDIDNDKPKRQYCIALDFDLTMTDIHTGGSINFKKNYWHDKQNLNSLIYVLEKYKNINWGIYVVTRNIESDVKKYLEINGFGNLIDKVFGAQNILHMNLQTDKWSLIKLNYLDQICKIESISKTSIYFYDDTTINIVVSKSNGYTNSIEIKKDLSKEGSNSKILVSELNNLLSKI